MTIALEPYPTFTYWVVYWRNRKHARWQLACSTWAVRNSRRSKRPWCSWLRQGKPLVFQTRKQAREHARQFRSYTPLEARVRSVRARKLPVRIPEKP